MILDKALPCDCGSTPLLKRVKLNNVQIDYFIYFCKNCGRSTFSTRLEEYCRELWNAAIFRVKNFNNEKKK